MLMLNYFDKYVRWGLKPIAVYRQTKCPIGKSWNENWSPEKWRHYFEQDDKFNMGIVLGDIIDVEGDTQEANDVISKMTHRIDHPMFVSSKSVHHLFKSPDPTFRMWKFKGIEFRGDKHQSVVPPSKHEQGETYSWLKITKIPPMPQELWQFYLDNFRHTEIRYKETGKNKEGYIKTTCNSCKKQVYIHKKRLKLEVQAFREHNSLWFCHQCRKIDVRNECREIRKNCR